MAERATITQRQTIGLETVENTAVAALKALTGLSFDTGIGISFSEFRSSGYRRNSLIIPGKKSTPISISGKPTYAELTYLLAGLYKKVTPTTPGGATNARDWTFAQSSTTRETIATYTLEVGDRVRAHRAAGMFLTGMGISGDPDTVDLSGEAMARAITDGVSLSTNEVQTLDIDATGGTFTVTFSGQTTSALAFNVSTSALQTALEALSTIGTGNVLVTGVAGEYTITFVNDLGQTNVAQMTTNAGSLTGGASTAQVATVTPGATPAELELRPIIPEHVTWYADNANGDLGTTKLTRVLSYSINDTGMRDGLYVVDASQNGSMVANVDLPPTGEITLLVEADTQGMAFYTTAQNGDTKFLRMLAQDDADSIESGFRYQLTADYAAKIKNIAPFTDSNGVYAIEYTFGIVHDSTWGKSCNIVLRNDLTSL